MSIITDALKKAEQERELRAKRVQEDAKVAVLEPVDIFLEQSDMVETSIEQNVKQTEPAETTASNHLDWFSSMQFREILTLSGIATLFLFVLLLLSYWAGTSANFSISWRPFQSGNLFQFNPVYQHRVSSMRLRGSIGGGVKLPFNLTGISVQGDTRYAIVNGVIVQKGDAVDGAHVTEILEREVVLETRAGEIKLKIQS